MTTMDARLLLILGAILAALGGATVMYRDIHDIRNAVDAREQRDQEQIRQAIREREDLRRGNAASMEEMRGATKAIRGFRFSQAAPAPVGAQPEPQPANNHVAGKGASK